MQLFKLTIGSVLTLLLLLAAASTTHAAGYTPIVPIPGINYNDVDGSQLVEVLYILAISFAALLAVGQLVIAGFQYITSDIVTNKEEAKQRIRAAIVGLLIILAAVVILRTINPGIANLPQLTAPPLPEATGLRSGRAQSVDNTPTGSVDVTCQDPSCAAEQAACERTPGYVRSSIDPSTGTLRCYTTNWNPFPGQSGQSDDPLTDEEARALLGLSDSEVIMAQQDIENSMEGRQSLRIFYQQCRARGDGYRIKNVRLSQYESSERYYCIGPSS